MTAHHLAQDSREIVASPQICHGCRGSGAPTPASSSSLMKDWPNTFKAKKLMRARVAGHALGPGHSCGSCSAQPAHQHLCSFMLLSFGSTVEHQMSHEPALACNLMAKAMRDIPTSTVRRRFAKNKTVETAVPSMSPGFWYRPPASTNATACSSRCSQHSRGCAVTNVSKASTHPSNSRGKG